MRALATVCLLASFAVSVPGADGVSARSKTVRIIVNGKSDWRIVCPPPGSPRIDSAARELQRCLQQSSGCKLPIVQRVRRKPALAIGLRPELSPDDRAVLPPPAPGQDAYAVAVVPATRKTTARIVIAGNNPHGVVCGVRDVLERLGCRSPSSAEDAKAMSAMRQDTILLPAGSWAVASPK